MKNLLGRLNARSTEDVARIAATWQIAIDGPDKLGMVATVYRALTDLRTIRDVWERLPEDERELIGALDGAPNITLTIPELAETLGVPSDEIRRRATSLFQKGLVVREGDDAELKVGELPRLFLPREIAILVRRVRAEIAAGDVSGSPLETLLATLDDGEVEESADAWGVHVIAGLKSRADLIRLLMAQVEDPLRRETVIAKLTGAPSKIWRQLRAAPNGRPMALSEALAAAELSELDPRAVHRERLALAELEGKLLVWHGYPQGGGRVVFIPADIREPGRQTAAEATLPTPAALDQKLSPKARHPHALAWDLLTFLRALADPGAPRIVDIDEAPRGWLRKLNRVLWNQGDEEPPEGYLAFLLDLAASEQLVVGGDVAAEQPYALTSEVRAWRSRAFADQSSRLRSGWLRAPIWIEGSERGDVEVWGADWAGFRLKLLTHLSAFADRQWRTLGDAAIWLAARDPEMLGSQFRAATARATEVSGDERASRTAAIAEVVAVTLGTAAEWLGLIETSSLPRQPRSMRLTALGIALAQGKAAPVDEPGKQPALEVTLADEVIVRDANPLRVWSLSAFADLVELGDESRYRLSEASVRRALAAGFAARQIVTYLAGETGRPLPGEVEARLNGWGRETRRVRVNRSLTIAPDDAAEVETLAALFGQAGMRVCQTEGALVVECVDQADEDRATALLGTNGYGQDRDGRGAGAQAMSESPQGAG